MRNLTKQEQLIISQIDNIQDAYDLLPVVAEPDAADFYSAIRQMKNILYARPRTEEDTE